MEECNEIAEEVKIVGKNEDKCSSCILYIVLFSYSLQLMLELLLILLTINTWIIIKKTFLNIIISIKQKIINHIKWEK